MSKAYKYWVIWVLLLLTVRVQAQHLFEHDYPVVQQEDPRIRHLMDQVSVDSLEATIQHMQSYLTRRWDTPMVYDVQDWLYETYRGMVLIRSFFTTSNLCITIRSVRPPTM